MIGRIVIVGVLISASPVLADDQIKVPSFIEPIVRYEPDRKASEIEKYNDPILQKGVDISVLEIEVLRRRLARAEERLEFLEKTNRQTVPALNQVIDWINTTQKTLKKQ